MARTREGEGACVCLSLYIKSCEGADEFGWLRNVVAPETTLVLPDPSPRTPLGRSVAEPISPIRGRKERSISPIQRPRSSSSFSSTPQTTSSRFPSREVGSGTPQSSSARTTPHSTPYSTPPQSSAWLRSPGLHESPLASPELDASAPSNDWSDNWFSPASPSRASILPGTVSPLAKESSFPSLLGGQGSSSSSPTAEGSDRRDGGADRTDHVNPWRIDETVVLTGLDRAGPPLDRSIGSGRSRGEIENSSHSSLDRALDYSPPPPTRGYSPPGRAYSPPPPNRQSHYSPSVSSLPSATASFLQPATNTEVVPREAAPADRSGERISPWAEPRSHEESERPETPSTILDSDVDRKESSEEALPRESLPRASAGARRASLPDYSTLDEKTRFTATVHGLDEAEDGGPSERPKSIIHMLVELKTYAAVVARVEHESEDALRVGRSRRASRSGARVGRCAQGR